MTEQQDRAQPTTRHVAIWTTVKVALLLGLIVLTYWTITGTYFGLEVDPTPELIAPQSYDDVMIVDNCAGVSPQVVPPHEILFEAGISIFPEDEVIRYPLFKSLGLGGATLTVSDGSSDLLRGLYDKRLARFSTDSQLKDLPIVHSPPKIDSVTKGEILSDIADSHPIDTSVSPEIQVPPGVFSISTMHWNRTWEKGVVTITTPYLPILSKLAKRTTYYYFLEVHRDFVGTKTEQLPCNSSLRDELWDSWIDHFEAGDQTTAIALVRQMTTMYPRDGMAKKALDALTNVSVVGGLTISGSDADTGQLQDGTDIAIRSRPCFPGKEGDSTVNYVSALRQREYVTILAEPVNDECGYDVKWSRIRTLEGLEGYVSTAFLLVPSADPLNLR